MHTLGTFIRENAVTRYNKIDAELVVDSREVLEARPRSTPPAPKRDDRDERDGDWDNAPCTD